MLTTETWSKVVAEGQAKVREADLAEESPGFQRDRTEGTREHDKVRTRVGHELVRHVFTFCRFHP
jgi:hypothetical protein